MWRANLLGSSGKGNEYFLRHLLGTDSAVRASEPRRGAPEVTWRDEAPVGKLDLLMSLGLPDDQHHAVRRHRAARRHLV